MAQTSKNMANLLAASSCDLGDEREVLRTLQAAFAFGDVVAHSDTATELAREIRASSPKLVTS
ncbi:hypothetical protein [Tardiphaga sp. 841_E9_N1_2]|uniref:hypothetical protein n=1 Tax=Tardiphaga sp. 841_E9_N1_2 TaxID=3240762 RepID=UPI003F1FA3D9